MIFFLINRYKKLMVILSINRPTFASVTVTSSGLRVMNKLTLLNNNLCTNCRLTLNEMPGVRTERMTPFRRPDRKYSAFTARPTWHILLSEGRY